MNNKIIFGIGGLVLGVLVTMFFHPFGGYGYGSMMFGGNNSDRGGDMMFGGQRQSMNEIDQHFIEEMIPHHEDAIDMANLALTKATHPEIKTLAQDIIQAQSSEIKNMQDWYKVWFGYDVKKGNTYSMMGGMMSSGGMHMVEGYDNETQILDNAIEFDKAFIENMIPHHQVAIMMTQMLKYGTDKPEMLTLANNIIESQSKEIEQMQGWYDSWYK